jgi:hypothetical protein
MHQHVDGSARMKIIPVNMNDVWTILESIDGRRWIIEHAAV